MLRPLVNEIPTQVRKADQVELRFLVVGLSNYEVTSSVRLNTLIRLLCTLYAPLDAALLVTTTLLGECV